MECSKPKKIIIAIDGFSSCGKSTFAKTIAAKLGYIFIDTGAMYRAVTLYALEHGAIVSGIVDEEKVIALLDDISIDFRFNPERGASDIYVNGDRAEGRIRTIEVSNCVSRVSAIAPVRRKLVAMQQEMGRRRGVVMDGDKAEQLRDRLRQRIRETENRTYLPMTVDEMRMLKAITSSTLHVIRNANKTVSLAKA